jgi:hypothetical protein
VVGFVKTVLLAGTVSVCLIGQVRFPAGGDPNPGGGGRNWGAAKADAARARVQINESDIV